MDITTIVIDIIAGAIGGYATGIAAKQYSIGTAGNVIAGLIGGVIGGWITLSIFGGAAAPGPEGTPPPTAPGAAPPPPRPGEPVAAQVRARSVEADEALKAAQQAAAKNDWVAPMKALPKRW